MLAFRPLFPFIFTDPSQSTKLPRLPRTKCLVRDWPLPAAVACFLTPSVHSHPSPTLSTPPSPLYPTLSQLPSPLYPTSSQPPRTSMYFSINQPSDTSPVKTRSPLLIMDPVPDMLGCSVGVEALIVVVVVQFIVTVFLLVIVTVPVLRSLIGRWRIAKMMYSGYEMSSYEFTILK